MIVVGLTGQIGTGKTKTSEIIKRIGYKVFSSDECSRNLIKNKHIKKNIKFLFEKKVKNIITSNNNIDTTKLGEYVFSNPKELSKLENLLHPLIKDQEVKFLKKSSLTSQKLVFIDIPIMFVDNNCLKCDFIINLFVNKQIQKRRVLSRSNMTQQKFENILKRQRYKRVKYNRYISININTGNGLFYVFRKIKKFLEKVKKKKNIRKVWPKKYIYFNYEKNNS